MWTTLSRMKSVVMGLQHENLKLVELIMELHHGSFDVVRLVLRPDYMDSYTCVSQ